MSAKKRVAVRLEVDEHKFSIPEALRFMAEHIGTNPVLRFALNEPGTFQTTLRDDDGRWWACTAWRGSDSSLRLFLEPAVARDDA